MSIRRLMWLVLIPAALGLSSCSVMMYGQQVARVADPFSDLGVDFLDHSRPELQKRSHRYGHSANGNDDASWVPIGNGGQAALWCLDNKGHFRLEPSSFCHVREAYAMYDGKKYVIPVATWRWDVPNSGDGFPVVMDIYALCTDESGNQHLLHGQVTVYNTNLNRIRDFRRDYRR